MLIFAVYKLKFKAIKKFISLFLFIYLCLEKHHS